MAVDSLKLTLFAERTDTFTDRQSDSTVVRR